MPQYQVEGLDDSFEGISSHKKWNGWECPLFDEETARLILSRSEKNGYTWQYRENAFFVKHEDDTEATRHQGIWIGRKILYPIGGSSWCWGLV